MDRISITDECYIVSGLIEGNSIDFVINYRDSYIQVININGKPVNIELMHFDRKIPCDIYKRVEYYISQRIDKIKEYLNECIKSKI